MSTEPRFNGAGSGVEDGLLNVDKHIFSTEN
jgi:hypothetical protein